MIEALDIASSVVEALDIACWKGPFGDEIVNRAVRALEAGMVLYAPQLSFELSESEARLLSANCLAPQFRNVSYRPGAGALQGASSEGVERDKLLAMMRRYYQRVSGLLKSLCPRYVGALSPGFTSYRPARIDGRATSSRDDDTRLHIDAFPSRPMKGTRILRVFTNVNPRMPRSWRVGEPFEQAAARFLPAIRPPLPGSSALLRLLRVVKDQRTPYDHFMLQIHDRMKADQQYQREAPQVTIDFPPGATWACFTDSVSHAAMSGQFAFEQTFHLPVSSMRDPENSPLYILERLSGRRLASE